MIPRLQLLGPPTLLHDGEVQSLPCERRTQLLAFVALKRTWVGRTELASLLWPELPAKLAYTNLRKSLFRLQGVAWGRHVQSEGGALRCEVATDVADFEAALRDGDRAAALASWQGELLEGFDDGGNPAWSGWLAFERERLHSLWRDAALGRAGEDIDPAQGIAISARLLEADPLDEAALRVHMTWLSRSGQVVRARQAYREFANRLETELGIAPGADLRAHHDALATSLPVAAVSFEGRLPAVDAGFVGRAVELRQLATMLGAGGCRLLTIVGPGGAGKTRFVQRALADAASTRAHGAVFVPLEDVRGVADIPARVAQELGLRVAAKQAPLDVVREFLRTREMLLVLDNVEHLVAGAPLFEGLLADAPGLCVVATSRVRLGIAGEQLLPLEGLPCPEPDDADRIESFDAARLFIQAAHRVEPALVPGVEASAIADICRQLDGLPLALELAAAWTRVLSCHAIAAELREGTGLLRSVDPTRPARHASFEVVLEHSWQLLGEAERGALARLSVFRGGFSPEAARHAAQAPLPLLLALVDKSLLRKEAGRLHLHPLVAEFAAARLAAAGGQGEVARAHARHYLDWLGQLVPALDRGATDAMQAVDVDFENCRAAWCSSVDRGMVDEILRGVRGLVAYCEHRGLASVARSLLEEALASPVAGNAKVRLDLSGRLAHLLYRLDRYDEAAAMAEAVLAGADPDRDGGAILQSLAALGGCGLRRGDLEAAQRHYRQAATLASRQGPRESAALLDNLAIVTKRRGDLDGALKLTIQALATLRRVDDAANLALCLSNLASHYQERGDFDSARLHLTEAKALTDRHGLVGTRAFVCANLAVCARHRGDYDEAMEHIAQGMAAAEGSGNRTAVSWLHYLRGSVALLQHDLPLARDELAAMVLMATAVASPYLTLGAVELLADVLAAEGQFDCARQLLRFAAAHPAADRPQAQELATRLAGLPSAEERDWPAMELAELAERIASEKDLAHAPLLAVLRAAPQMPRSGGEA